MRALHAAVALAMCIHDVVLTDCGLAAYGAPATGYGSRQNSRTLPSEAEAAAMATKRKSGYVDRPDDNDVQEVVRAWWTVKEALSLKYIGVTILMTFLKLYPEYFESFAGMEKGPVEHLPHNNQFVAKSISFIYDISSMLDNLDDLDLVEILCKRFGERKQRDGATKTSFDDLRNLILHFVARYHKQHALSFPLGIEESTSRTLYWMFYTMKKGFVTKPT